MRNLLLLFSLLLAVEQAQAAPTWRNLGPGGGGWIPCLAVSPLDSRVVYAGCDVGGFYKSTDGGATWSIHNTGLHDYYVEVILPHPRDPRILYVGTEGGVHKSTDGGETWQWLRTGFPAPDRYSYSAPIGALALAPTEPETLYAGIGRPRSGKGGIGTVYRSTDGGAHWQVANPGGGGMDPKAIVSDLVVHPQNSRLVYAATDRGVYRSDDSGANWRHIEKGLPQAHARRIALCRAHPETLYLTIWSKPGAQPWQGGVYRSDDGGENWRSCLQGLETRVGKPGEAGQMTSNVDRLVVDPRNPEIVYTGDTAWVSAGVYRSGDGGRTWKNVTNSQSPAMEYGWITMWGPSVMGLAMDPRQPDTLYFSTSGHLFRTMDGGAHWQTAYTQRAAKPAGAPDVHGGCWRGNGLEVTCLHNVVVHPRDSKHLYFCYYDIGLLQSLDGGRSFIRPVTGMHYQGNCFTVAFDPDNPQIVYAGTGEWGANHGDVCRSEDDGFTWKVLGKPETGLPDGQTRTILVDRDSPAAARRIFVTVSGAGVYCSEDGGASWQARNEGLPNKAIRGLVQSSRDPKTLYALLAGDKQNEGGIYRSSDRGLTWTRIGGDFVCPNGQALRISPSDPRRLYVTAREGQGRDGKAYSGGVYASRDGGESWQRVFENHFMVGLAVDPRNPDTLYAGGNDNPYHDDAIGLGVMRSRDGGVTWESLNTTGLSNRNISCLAVDPQQPTRLYAGTGGNGVFVLDE